MRKSSLLLVLTLSSLSMFPVASAGPWLPAQTGRIVVKVNRFVAALQSQGKGYFRLSYDYEFSQTTRIYIVGVGAAPPRGSFSYLTPEKTLTFLNEQKQILKVVNLQVTGTPEGAGSRLPTPDEFPVEFKSFVRNGQLTSEQVNAALNSVFESGYFPRMDDNRMYYVTTLQPLKNAAPNKLAFVALQISVPYATDNPSRISFRMQMLVRERGRGSPDFSKDVTAQSLTAACEVRKRVAESLGADVKSETCN